MSDTKQNFDDYIFDNVLEDTYLAIKDVRENIDRQAKETREIDFDYNPYEGRDEREKLDKVITKNIVDSIKDRLYNVDFENKLMRGVNVEAVRSVVGRDDFSTFFRPSQILKDSIDTEEAIQLMSPMDGVRYYHMCGDIEYPVKFSELMFKATTETLCGLMLYSRLEPIVDKGFANLAKDIDSARVYSQVVSPRLIDHFEDCAHYLKEKTADMSLSDKTQETIDRVCANFEWNETKRIEARFADVVAQEGRKTIDVPEAVEDDKDLEYQISVSLLVHLVILDVLVLPRFVRPRSALFRRQSIEQAHCPIALLDVQIAPLRYADYPSMPCRARRPCPSGLVHRASSMSKQKLNPCDNLTGVFVVTKE